MTTNTPDTVNSDIKAQFSIPKQALNQEKVPSVSSTDTPDLMPKMPLETNQSARKVQGMGINSKALQPQLMEGNDQVTVDSFHQPLTPPPARIQGGPLTSSATPMLQRIYNPKTSSHRTPLVDPSVAAMLPTHNRPVGGIPAGQQATIPVLQTLVGSQNPSIASVAGMMLPPIARRGPSDASIPTQPSRLQNPGRAVDNALSAAKVKLPSTSRAMTSKICNTNPVSSLPRDVSIATRPLGENIPVMPNTMASQSTCTRHPPSQSIAPVPMQLSFPNAKLPVQSRIPNLLKPPPEQVVALPPKLANESPSSTFAATRTPNFLKGNQPPCGELAQGTSTISHSTQASISKVAPVPTPLDPHSILEEKVRKERLPLVEKYGPFIAPNDTSLRDARERLETSLGQIRQLRAAFTERVYGKYRVCLRPPPATEEILDNCRREPAKASQKLQEEMQRIKDEKEVEKKEAQTLNAEINGMESALISMNADNAEQLMFISAGLSLVILPEEDVDPKLVADYQDRAPMNPETGQRVRSISQAAAAAGEVILDRTRKGAAMRAEWQRRRQLQLSESSDGIQRESDHQNYSRLNLVANTTTPIPIQQTATVSASKPTTADAPSSATPTSAAPKALAIKRNSVAVVSKVAAASAPLPAFGTTGSKSSRSRGATGLSGSVLLSLNPAADELPSEKCLRSSTTLLMTRGVGSMQVSRASPQQRLRHPHPDSLGGRQRLLNLGNAKKELATLTTPNAPGNGCWNQTYLTLALPPLPTPTERHERKSHDLLEPPSYLNRNKAYESVKGVLSQFVEKKPEELLRHKISRIGLSNGVSKLIETRANVKPDKESSSQDMSSVPVLTRENQRTVNPSLVLSVLHAVGLIKDSDESMSQESALEQVEGLLQRKENQTKGEDSFLKLQETWKSLSSRKRRFSEAILGSPSSTTQSVKRAKNDSSLTVNTSVINTSLNELPGGPGSPAVAVIRGGGELLQSSGDNNASGIESRADQVDSLQDGKDDDSRKLTNPVPIRLDGQNHENPHMNIRGDRQQLAPHSQAPTRRMVWDDTQQNSLAMMNSRLAGNATAFPGNQPGARLPGQHLHPHHQQTTLNALQIAHQLHHATNTMGLQSRGTHTGGDRSVADYVGGLGHSAHWNPIGAASAAAMAAALGIGRPMGVYGTVQDRTSRALLAREHQNVAAAAHAVAHQQFMNGASGVGFQPAPGPFHIPNARQVNQVNALLNASPAQMMAAPPPTSRPCTHPQSIDSSSKHSALPPDKSDKKPGHTHDIKRESQMKDVRHKSLAQSAAQRTNHVGKNAKQSKEEKVTKSAPSDVFKSRKRTSSTNSLGAIRAPEGVFSNVASSAKRLKKGPQQGPVEVMSVNGANPIDNKEVRPNAVANSMVSKSQATPVGTVSVTSDVKSPSPVLALSPTIVAVDKSKSSSAVDAAGAMKFFQPPSPDDIAEEIAKLVRSGRFHDSKVYASAVESAQKMRHLVDYLLAVGSAIPIPRALISAPLKDRLGNLGFKNSGINIGLHAPREVIVAATLVWLWTHEEGKFQRAFAKSGRIDVDPDCKWLLQVAIDTAVSSIRNEISDIMLKKPGSLAALLVSNSSKTDGPNKGPIAADDERTTDSSSKLEFVTASVVSKALTKSVQINDNVDLLIPQSELLVKFLDECRECALVNRTRERVLLANLVSRKVTMSESFSHAYVSSVVRAGEAVGHEKIIELVLDEENMVSSMLSYDAYKDVNESWEDPCRPIEGFTVGLNGEVLMRLAHARAMMQKSLKKLQDRHNIKQGTSTFGAYADTQNGQQVSGSSGQGGSASSTGTPSQRLWTKRRSSFSEPAVMPGTGSAQATRSTVYEPKHYSAPLVWNSNDIENQPYGRHNIGERPRSLSMTVVSGRTSTGRGSKNWKRSLSFSADLPQEVEPSEADKRVQCSTREIPWADVARTFQSVQLPGIALPEKEKPKTPLNKKIIAPFCRQFAGSPVATDDESDEENEDLSDGAILSRHQVVLDRMKDHLSAFFENRKKQQDRRKSRRSNSEK